MLICHLYDFFGEVSVRSLAQVVYFLLSFKSYLHISDNCVYVYFFSLFSPFVFLLLSIAASSYLLIFFFLQYLIYC